MAIGPPSQGAQNGPAIYPAHLIGFMHACRKDTVASALEDAIRDAEQVVEDAEQERKKRGRKRPRKDDRKFPGHFSRYEKVVDLPEDAREGLKFVGYDEVETLEVIRSEFRVRVTMYAKYAHPADKSKGIVSPERPIGRVEGDRFDASIGVEVVAAKYFYHLPFYRQQDLFAGAGWTPSRSTLQNIEASVEFALRPLAEYLRSFLKQHRTVGCDDTGVLSITPAAMPDLSNHPRGERIGEVLEKAIADGKPSITANMWGYYASRLPVVAFDFTVSRHRDGPDEVLYDFERNLLGDCWSGFQKINVRSDSRITFATCCAHARRKIDECRGAFPIQVAKLESLIRKNGLFKGSVEAGERAANLLTIVVSAVRNDLDVGAYMQDVLERTLEGETDWSALAPHAWKAEHPESIRTYRQDERRQSADRKRTRRARRRLSK